MTDDITRAADARMRELFRKQHGYEFGMPLLQENAAMAPRNAGPGGYLVGASDTGETPTLQQVIAAIAREVQTMAALNAQMTAALALLRASGPEAADAVAARAAAVPGYTKTPDNRLAQESMTLEEFRQSHGPNATFAEVGGPAPAPSAADKLTGLLLQGSADQMLRDLEHAGIPGDFAEL